MDTVEFSAEGRFRVALNRAVGEIEPVLVMVKVFPDLEKDAPFPLVKEKFPSTPLESVTLTWLPLMVMVGAELALLLAPSGTFWAAFWINALTVGAGQLIACYVIGLPLFAVIDRSPLGKILSDSDKNNEHNIKR